MSARFLSQNPKSFFRCSIMQRILLLYLFFVYFQHISIVAIDTGSSSESDSEDTRNQLYPEPCMGDTASSISSTAPPRQASATTSSYTMAATEYDYAKNVKVLKPDEKHTATVVFLHGLGDEGSYVILYNIARLEDCIVFAWLFA
jgi:Phospholipase/Carboxylesterase